MTTPFTVLAKYRGTLCIFKATRCAEGENGKCPNCGGNRFEDVPHGWTECVSCRDFSFLSEEVGR